MKKLLFSALLLLSTFITHSFCFYGPQAYFRAEVGGSFSRCADICLNNNDWTITNEGYNRDLDRVPMFGFGLGFHANSLLSLGLSGQYRSKYSYCKQQTINLQQYATPINEDFFPSLDGFTRIFNLDNLSFMFDIFINRAGRDSYYSWCIGNYAFIPYTGFSVGLSKNMVYNFHTATNDTDNVGEFSFRNTRAIMNYTSFNDVGWQFHLGFDASVKDIVLLGLGYRYYDGGTFCSNNYTIDDLDEVRLYHLTPWKADLRAHEVVGSLSISF